MPITRSPSAGRRGARAAPDSRRDSSSKTRPERSWSAATSRAPPTLFPDLAADWLRLCEQAERLAGLGDLVDVTAATVDGARRRRGRAPGRPQIDLHQLRAAALEGAPDEAASLVDAARAAALDTLGDTDGVAAIAERRLRAERGA